MSAYRRKLLSVLTVVALLSLAQTAGAQSSFKASSRANEDEIRAATLLFYATFNSALQGDFAPMTVVWSHRGDVSSLSAAGGHAVGWNEVFQAFQNMGRLYPGGRIVPSDITVVAGKDMGYSICTETGQLRSSEGPMVSFNQRATNVFRLEGGTWKLVHHHADSNLNDSEKAATR